jgi:hypothetical protein
MSLLAIANRTSGTVGRVCGICQRAFRLPIDNLVLVRTPGVPIEWDIDIGGYCTRCEDYRCERHVGTYDSIDSEPGFNLPIVALFCVKCRERLVFGR